MNDSALKLASENHTDSSKTVGELFADPQACLELTRNMGHEWLVAPYSTRLLVHEDGTHQACAHHTVSVGGDRWTWRERVFVDVNDGWYDVWHDVVYNESELFNDIVWRDTITCGEIP